MDKNLEAVRQLAAIPAGEHRIAPGETMIINVQGGGDDTGAEEIEVDGSGSISLRFLPNLKVGGKTSAEIRELIRKSYIEGQIYKNVSVNVIFPAKSFFVEGKVVQRGRYPYEGRTTALQAIATAGGPDKFAHDNVFITRGNRVIKFSRKTMQKDPRYDPEILPGDKIKVDVTWL